jgi:hypothetical protein
MKFMMILKADATTESGAMPTETDLLAMGKYNQSLIDAGVMLAGEGLHPSSAGARVYFEKGQRRVVDGPFAETKELIAGFWMLQVKSKEEAIEWARRVPFAVDGPSATAGGTGQIELRRVFEAADFAPVITSDEGRALLDAEQAFRERTNV